MRAIRCWVVQVIFSILILQGCSNDLPRSKAAELIRESTALRDGSYSLRFSSRVWGPEADGLVVMGYIVTYRSSSVITKLEVTPAGKEAGVSQDDFFKRCNVPVAKPEIVEVTGISRKENSAEVVFTYRFNRTAAGEAALAGRMGEDWKRLMLAIQDDQTGKALFRLYDDGWRLEKLEINTSPYLV